jgi:putative ABC transport system permease protein
VPALTPRRDPLHRLLLSAYPPAFRARHGDDLERAWRVGLDAAAERGRLYRVFAAMVGAADIVWSGLAERRAAARAARHLPGAGRRRPMTLDTLVHDVRFGIRLMRRSPLFSGLAMLALALGIGANGAVFAVVDNVLLRPLPYRAPGELVMIWSNNTNANAPHNPVSPADYLDYRGQNATLAGLEAMQSFLAPSQFADGPTPDVVQTATMSTGMFGLLGRDALHGRVFKDGDANVMILTHAFWQRRYGGDESVVGRRVTLSGVAGTVVGIMPRDFVFPFRTMLGPSGFVRAQTADVFLPMQFTGGFFLNADGTPARRARFLGLIGRLKPGTTIEAARADLSAVAGATAAKYPDLNAGWGATLLTLHDQTVGTARPAVFLLLGGVAVVLLMACVNVANLLLSQSVSRRRETALRAALGASRARLLQQSLVESLLLAFGGGVAGASLLFMGVRALVALAPPDTPRLTEIAPNAVVFAYTFAVAMVTGLFTGSLPAITGSRADLQSSLKADGRGATMAVARRRLRGRLIIGEVALAVLLTAGSTLLLRSFIAVLNVDPGFRPDQALTFQLNLPARLTMPHGNQPPSQQAYLAFYDELFGRIERLPGVVAAGGTTRLPLGSTNVSTLLQIEGRDVPAAKLPEVEFRRAVHHYFDAMGIPVVRGRGFTEDDRLGGPSVAVVNRALEQKLFSGEDPIGRRVRMGSSATSPWTTIVGVVGSVRHGSLEEAPRPELYVSGRQNPPVSPFVVVRTSGDPARLIAATRNEIRSVDPTTPIFDMKPMAEILSDSISERRFVLLLVGAFAVVALMMAAVGVYGVMALAVSERRVEVGVRMAMGARPSQILSLVLGQAARLGVAGVGIGLAAALVALPFMATQLFGVTPYDVVTLGSVTATLLGVALLAAYLPARRAMRVDPVVALRD